MTLIEDRKCDAHPDHPEPMPVDGRARNRLKELDALRGIAAISVMLFHYTSIYPDFFPEHRSIPLKFEAGGYGVFLFFGISGFVISRTLENTAGMVDFTVKRIVRLFPAYWAAVLFTTLVVQLSGADRLQAELWTVLINLTMLQGFFFVPSVDGVYWTLTVELAFYLCAALAWTAKDRFRLEHLLTSWMAVGAFAHISDIVPYRVQMLLVNQYSPFFAIGVLTYRVWAGQRRYFDQLPYFSMALAILGFVGGPAFLVAGIGIQAMLWMTIEGHLCAIRHPLFVYLGTLSYPLYLIHHHAGFVLLQAADRARIGPATSIIIVSMAMLGLAALLHHGIEAPAERVIRTWWFRRRGPQPA